MGPGISTNGHQTMHDSLHITWLHIDKHNTEFIRIAILTAGFNQAELGKVKSFGGRQLPNQAFWRFWETDAVISIDEFDPQPVWSTVR